MLPEMLVRWSMIPVDNLEYHQYTQVWTATVYGYQMTVSSQVLRWLGQRPDSYFRHEMFLMTLAQPASP